MKFVKSMFCRRCHYQLDGLSESRCPECGQVFDPDDSTSYISIERRDVSLEAFKEVKLVLFAMAVAVATIALALWASFIL